MSASTLSTKPAIGTIWRNGITAAIVAAVINAILYYAGLATGNWDLGVITPMGTSINIVPVVVMSIATIVAGTLGYTIVSRFVSNPNLWFIVATAIVFLLMLAGPFQLGAPVGMVVLLQLMHVVAAGSAIYFLTRS
jgi:hypothetical protein